MSEAGCETSGLAASHVTVRHAGGPFNRDWWLIPLILVDTAPPALPGSARVAEPSNGRFSSRVTA
jgi:hypothetical protein